jgi:LPS sulfotransferase NodH
MMKLGGNGNGLNPAHLYSVAQKQTGLWDFGDPQISTRLTVLTASIEREANLHRTGRFLLKNYLLQLLKSRLVLEQTWKDLEPARNGTIKAPIFITGIPRSGSTFLHELLAADPANRVLSAWEILEPVGRHPAVRRWKTAMSLWMFRRLTRGADAVHPLRANSPHECVSLHSYTLLSREFGTMLRVPAYDGFLDQIDFTPAYVWQKRFMQRAHFNGHARWVLKAPDHAYSLDALFKVFPDAIIIQTHRAPMEVIKSATRLAYVVRKPFSDALDLEQIAQAETEALQRKISRIMDFREARPELADRFIDVTYHKLTAEPVKMIEHIYEQLNYPFSKHARCEVEQLAMRSGRYPQEGLTCQLRNTRTDERADTGQFAVYAKQFGVS